jgi:zona occludens toxin (predicted ATPase)
VIYLVTGTPGAGKTLYVVRRITTDVGKQRLPDGSLRPIFHNITAFRPGRIPSDERRKVMRMRPADRRAAIRARREAWAHVQFDAHGAEKWQTYPPGSVVVVDEAQQHWGAELTVLRSPDHLSSLSIHRHRGADIWVITQHPSLVSTIVRNLCGRHYDVTRPFGMKLSALRSWEGCNPSPPRPVGDDMADVERLRFDRRLFSMYRSAQVHTQTFRLPRRVVVTLTMMLAVFSLVGWLGVPVFMSWFAMAASVDAPSSDGSALGDAAPAVSGCFPILSRSPLVVRGPQGVVVIRDDAPGLDLAARPGSVCIRRPSGV